MGYDLVVRNGTVLDGSGSAAFRADVGVIGGRIARIGRIREHGSEEVDAEGRVVTPGFIDGHTHMDAQLFWDRPGTNSCYHGITTVVMGHCGFTLAPAHADARQLVVRNLERAEDISGAAMAAGIDWTWESFAEYLDAVDAQPKALNYAANIGHSALRTFAMGERAFDGPATEDDLVAMEAELCAALAAGAFGFTTSRSTAHETSDNRPVASRLASWSEVRRLVCAMGEMGDGIFQITPEPGGQSPDPEVRDEWYGRMRDLCVESGTVFSLPVGATKTSRYGIDFLDSTAAAGGRVFGLSHSRGVSVLLSFGTRLPFDVLPEWREVRSLPLDVQRKALLDPAHRARLVEAARHGDYGNPIGAEARRPDYDLIQVFDRPDAPNRTVASVAAERGVDPIDALIDLALESDFDQFFFQPVTRYEPEDLLAVMRHPRTVMTFSDSGAHVSQVSDSSIQTYLLAYWVRERQAIPLEEAVRMITLLPANAWGLSDRGLVREGFVADLNVFDPATVGPRMPKIVYDLPGGGRRLEQRADGFSATVIAGTVVQRDGEYTGALPGVLLRGPMTDRAA